LKSSRVRGLEPEATLTLDVVNTGFARGKGGERRRIATQGGGIKGKKGKGSGTFRVGGEGYTGNRQKKGERPKKEERRGLSAVD